MSRNMPALHSTALTCALSPSVLTPFRIGHVLEELLPHDGMLTVRCLRRHREMCTVRDVQGLMLHYFIVFD